MKEATMKLIPFLFCIFLVILYPLHGQQIHSAGGGEPINTMSAKKAAIFARSQSRNVQSGSKIFKQGGSAKISRSGDRTEISSFPFQEPFTYGTSYYEACPFTLGNGDLLVVYVNSGFKDSLFSVRSTDNGTTWSSPVLVCRSSSTINYVSGVRTSSGRLLIVWQDYSTGLTESTSDDDGMSWSTPRTITTNYDEEYTSLSQTLDGRIWLSYSRYFPPSAYDTYYRSSTDDGNSWSTEKTFSASAYDEYYVVFASRDSSTILSVSETNATGYYGLYSQTSSDGGNTWSSPVAIEASATTNARPRLLRQSDGSLWLIYQHYRPCAGSLTQSEIAYKKSTDGGSTWSAISYFTNYAGYDGWFSTCLKDSQPFVTFSSYRWAAYYGQRHLWYGLIGTSVDNNPPPALNGYNNTEPLVDSLVVVHAYVDDESGIENVQLNLNADGIHSVSQMYDDGMHGDMAPGDKIYGASVGPFKMGDKVTIAVSITDGVANSVNITVTSFEVYGIHNAGNVILSIGTDSELGDFGAPGSSAYWPKTNGYDYLFDGGLWATCRVRGDTAMVVHDYPSGGFSWKQTYGSTCKLARGISDQDGDLTYDDLSVLTGPIGLTVHQRSYQWSDSTRDDFIIFKYTIFNRGDNGTLNGLYIAQWLDPDVAVETTPFDNLVDYDNERHMLYIYNMNGDPSGLFGLRLLGASKTPCTVLAYAAGEDPVTPGDHYRYMAQGNIFVPTSINDYRFLLTAQPLTLSPNDSSTVAYGIVLGNGQAELETNADTMEAIYEAELAEKGGSNAVQQQAVNLAVPDRFQLKQNYPNPFNPSTSVSFDVPKSSFVTLRVFNLLGQQVATMVAKNLPPGTHRYNFDAGNLPSGVYLYCLRAGDYVETRKMVLLR